MRNQPPVQQMSFTLTASEFNVMMTQLSESLRMARAVEGIIQKLANQANAANAQLEPEQQQGDGRQPPQRRQTTKPTIIQSDLD